MTKHRITNSRNSRNSDYIYFGPKSIRSNDEDRINEEIAKEYSPFKNKIIHLHIHPEYKLPHIHKTECESLITGRDNQREKRYYFTNELTPVRVYIKYESIKMELLLRNKIKGVSDKFQKEVASCRFIEETLSFVPIIRNEQNNLRRLSNKSE
jgi:hypothetical protein